jgi:peptidoglycan hydrolase-like protein with peptidoglycan-binding domain
VYQDLILKIANTVMENEYDRPVTSSNFGLMLNETATPGVDTANEIDEEIAEETDEELTGTSKVPACEGRTCWSKTVLNKLFGLSLPLNNTLDETSRQAIADFQVKSGLSQTKTIDAATERALLEADSIQNQGTAAASIISEAKTRIEDWTSQGLSGVKNKPQHILNSFRDPGKIWAFVLHQMAFKRRGRETKQYSDPTGYVNTGAHFCIMLDGRIIQLHALSRMIWHGNCVSPRSVAVEFEGNFPNVKGTWWIDKKSTIQNKDLPTQAQYDSGRFLTRYLKTILNTTHILAHRQSSDSRENDPGPDIWYNVGEWAINNLGLTDGGVNFKCGTGNPILAQWKTWGDKSATLTNKEYNENDNEIDWEYISDESIFPATETDEDAGEEPGDHEVEDEDIITDMGKAVRLNRYYANTLGWDQYHDQINNLLLPFSGQENVSLGEESFAQAAAQWQMQNGLSADGVIGPGTWSRMKPALVVPTNTTRVEPTTQTARAPGNLGKLLIDTSVPALSKSLPEYQFTSEDAVWLARFVEGEAGGQDNPDSHAVIWAMFNRFGILRHRVPSWTSFAVFLQKYSTTLQPLLNSSGAAERVWMNHKSNPAKYPVVSSGDTYPGTSIKKVQYQRHIDLQNKQWTAFPAYVRDMILKILTGQIPNPGIGIASDFDSTYVFLKVARRKQGISGEPSHEEWKQYTLEHARSKKVIWIGEKSNLDQKKNAFYIQPFLKDVPSNAVTIARNLGSAEVMYEENMDEIDAFADYADEQSSIFST